ncbi:MAG: tRNA uracil 4-sulfurtransferase ThiI [Acidobacteriota bacterium]
MDRCFLCHYHEIALKRGNRVLFENQLCRNIERALAGLPIRSVRRFHGRVIVGLTSESPVREVGSRLQNVFGIVNCSPAWVCEPVMRLIEKKLEELLRDRDFASFKIHARRANKSFPLTSPEINRRLGEFVVGRWKKKVRLDNPVLTCYVHLVNGHAFLYFERLPGSGGLPVGSAGKVVVLLSGGIDSPVAAYKVLRRGCRVIFVHFHSYPHTSLDSQQKVRQLVHLLSRFQYRSTLYMVPFAEAQRTIVALTPAETRVILYRRLMLRIGEHIARREHAQALVTGESIGQVASQTLENIGVISRATQLPVLRPLIGEDKEDIIHFARRIGTYPISILPDEDCCSLFVPPHPATRATLGRIERIETDFDPAAMATEARLQSVREKIEFESGLAEDFTPARHV